jgi:hypothetical protein
LKIGQYTGKSYRWVSEQDSDYCQRILYVNPDNSLRDLVDWLISDGVIQAVDNTNDTSYYTESDEVYPSSEFTSGDDDEDQIGDCGKDDGADQISESEDDDEENQISEEYEDIDDDNDQISEEDNDDDLHGPNWELISSVGARKRLRTIRGSESTTRPGPKRSDGMKKAKNVENSIIATGKQMANPIGYSNERLKLCIPNIGNTQSKEPKDKRQCIISEPVKENFNEIDSSRSKTFDHISFLGQFLRTLEESSDEDVEPPNDADVEESRNEDVESPNDADVEPPNDGDIKPPNDGDIKPPNDGDIKPSNDGNIKPSLGGDVELSNDGDVKLSNDGDVKLSNDEYVEPSRDEDVEPNCKLTTTDSSSIIGFGKYRYKTYDWVRTRDSNYCLWVLSVYDATGSLLDFQQWLKQ